ncbi:ABC transporter substrate-binding protein [Pseudooceanicola nanhaiensis]|uniref:ABC transporter substrate-binding protein n=1 Tax=Pseudooceanicola nanhaiensis TaxID=375761 RepID=UPI001CD2364B|nr:ABC transporter substrate-binding protein [Pseudooceanicola nanhaiensis]MCA0921417.1 ABC transporter substrate-binding protein [Pseudooceanicola nanhaiensis]
MKQFHSTTILSCLTGLTLAAAPLQALAQDGEKVLNYAFSQDIRGTQPGVDRDGATDTAQMHVVEGLVGYATDFSIKPVLADSYEISDDGLTYTFKLREGVKFHNGETMTAENVKWSWDRYMNPETKWRCLSYFDGSNGVEVTSMEVVDPLTVVFTISAPSATFLGNMARFDCGATAVLHSDSVDADGKWIAPIGTGPFTFGDIRPGQYFDLVKFDDYSVDDGPADGYTGAKIAMVDRVRFNILDEAAIKKTAFLAGDVDITSIDGADYEEIDGLDTASVLTVQTAVWESFLINVRDPLLSKPAMRKAIAHALDRDTIVEVATEGRGTPNASPVPPMSSFYGEVEQQGPEYDPELAKKYLEEAGYNGEELVIITSNRSGGYFERSVIAQSMLAAVGINAKIETIEWGTQIDLYNSGEYQMMSFAYSARLDPALSFEMITGEEGRKVLRTPEALATLEKAMSISEPVERQKLIDELQVIFNEEIPAYSINHRPQFFAVSDKVKGFNGWGAAKEIFWGVELVD